MFELIRSHCNRIQALPNEVMMMTTNLPSGYHRDLQLLKEHIIPAFKNLQDCIEMTCLMLENVQIKTGLLKDEKYKFLFSVEEVNKLVAQGVPFREAYTQIGSAIEQNKFTYSTAADHTHEGSIGNLCNPQIQGLMESILQKFNFSRSKIALQQLLE